VAGLNPDKVMKPGPQGENFQTICVQIQDNQIFSTDQKGKHVEKCGFSDKRNKK
jgi:hypothetical protein